MISKKIILNLIKVIFNNINTKLNQNPRFRALIYSLYEVLSLIDFKLRSLLIKNSMNHYENIIYINPNRIIYEKDLKHTNWRLFLKFIKPLINPNSISSIEIIDGDWDLKENLRLFEDDIKHKSYFMHFIENVEWKDTPYYKREAERYLKGRVRKSYNSNEELNLKYKYHDNLFNKIKREGFKTQKEIIQLEGRIINYGHGKIFRKLDDDITVGIGRDGEIIFFDGRHRLNVAKLLKLKKIPVRVLVMHSEFFSKLKN